MISALGASSTPVQLTPAERDQLFSLAKRSLEASLDGAPLPTIADPSPLLQAHGAAFVSIYNGADLRGCIGTFSRIAPLWEVVQRMVLMAASEDPRFAPIKPEERDALRYELSVLTKPGAIEGPEDIRIGQDGLVISNTKHRGVLLPQVAVKQGWDPETFLSNTCRKAGLPEDAWLKPTVLIERFQADVFGDAVVVSAG